MGYSLSLPIPLSSVFGPYHIHREPHVHCHAPMFLTVIGAITNLQMMMMMMMMMMFASYELGISGELCRPKLRYWGAEQNLSQNYALRRLK